MMRPTCEMLVWVAVAMVSNINLPARGQTPNAAPIVAETWQRGYTGDSAAGEHVLAYWKFSARKETADSSGQGHVLRLNGAKPRADGRFDDCLESFPGWPTDDKQHAALAKNHPALSPRGPFTVEMWVKPQPAFKSAGQCYLLDKKYFDPAGYQLLLSSADGAGKRRLVVNLGFGSDSSTFSSEPESFPAGEWHHIAFSYDAHGTVRFFRDGARLGQTRQSGRGPIAGSKNELAIGDRLGSLYGGFPGFLDEVRICEGTREFRPARVIAAWERTVFVRKEPAARLTFTIQNLQAEPLSDAELSISVPGQPTIPLKLPALAAGSSHPVEWILDTAMRPDEYEIDVRLILARTPAFSSSDRFRVRIVPRPLPHRMPVVMWGLNSPDAVLQELPRLKDLGFTHSLGFGADYGSIWKAGAPVAADSATRVAETKRMLDTALEHDLGIIASLSPIKSLQDQPKLQRIDRAGTPYKRLDVCAATPGLAEFSFNVGASVARTYGHFPAFQAALSHSEVRDDSELCFHEHDRVAYRKFSGREIPDEAMIKNGVHYNNVKDFPANRIVSDDHPLLVFYRWFWQQGDGWNRMHTELTRGLKSTARQDLWTFYDPAVRVPSLSGSGGAVDVVSHWSYTYPDPIRIGLATDQLFAMARHAAQPQRVMKMTQVIWYRSETAPIRKPAANTPSSSADRPLSIWADRDPDAAYVTIAPAFLREALWTKLARPIQGVMYHGWQSLVPTEGNSAYRYTHPDTQHELRRLVREVLEPLGPSLMQVPDRPTDVAFLESFTSQMFARRGGYGYNGGWSGDAWHVLQFAHLQPEVLYEKDLLRNGLAPYRLLVLVDCDVLPAAVAKRVREFQSRGGLVIGDERLTPGVKPDILLPSYTRKKEADRDKEALLSRASDLRKSLRGKYARYVDSSNPDLIPRCRTAGTTDYLFLVNDRREFGSYVGDHGLVMDHGLPSDAVAMIRRTSGHVYDLISRRHVPAELRGDRLQWPVQLGPCDGRVFIITDRPISRVIVTASGSTAEVVSLGQPWACKIAVVDPENRPIDATIPLQVEIVDPNGRRAEFSGYYGAAHGQLPLTVEVASNDVPGMWQVRVRELATGLESAAYFRVSAAK